jgi:rubrerythrin
MEYITWRCKDCEWEWVGDYTDTWCPYCDEQNIYSPTHKI